MTNPDYSEDEGGADPAMTVLRITTNVFIGITLATIAATGLVAYAAARAGQETRSRVDEAVGEIGREMRGATRQMA